MAAGQAGRRHVDDATILIIDPDGYEMDKGKMRLAFAVIVFADIRTGHIAHPIHAVEEDTGIPPGVHDHKGTGRIPRPCAGDDVLPRPKGDSAFEFTALHECTEAPDPFPIDGYDAGLDVLEEIQGPGEMNDRLRDEEIGMPTANGKYQREHPVLSTLEGKGCPEGCG